MVNELNTAKMHLMMNVIHECINREFTYFHQLYIDDISDTQEYDSDGELAKTSEEETFQSRVTILDSDIDDNGHQFMQVDITIHELINAERMLSINGGFIFHEKNGIDEVQVYIKPFRSDPVECVQNSVSA